MRNAIPIETSSLDLAADERGRILGKAVLRAASALGLTQGELASTIGLSPASVSRMKDARLGLSGKPFELAACLVRVFRSLDAISGGDEATMRGWMRNPNLDLGAIPAEAVTGVPGLFEVMTYLDARRAPL